MLTRQEINELADSELNKKLWELSGFDNSKLKLSQSGIMYTHSLDGQFNFAKLKKLKYAVLFSPDPELDWEGEADQNYIFLYDSIEGGQEEISNSLRAGAEILLWLTQERGKMDIEGQIADACNEAYLRAGHNAYFGNGFTAGAEFAIDRIIDYIENDAEILIPSIEFLGNPLTKEEYGRVLLKYLVVELRDFVKHHNKQSIKIAPDILRQ